MVPSKLIMYAILAIVVLTVVVWVLVTFFGLALGFTFFTIITGNTSWLVAIPLALGGFFLLIGWPFRLPYMWRLVAGGGLIFIAALMFMGVL